MDGLSQIGIGGIFALLVIREVLNYLKTRNGYPPVKTPNPHIDSVRMGDLAASIMLKEFGDIKEGLRRIETLMIERFPKE